MINPLQLPQANINSLADFSPLANLGNVYQKAQEEQRRRDALAQLGQGQSADAATLIKSGDMGLAQLGLNLQNRTVDQQREDARYAVTDRRADTQLGLAQNADRRAALTSERENMTPDEQIQERQLAAERYGLKPGTPDYNFFLFNGKLPDTASANRAGLSPFFGTRKGPNGEDVPVMMQPTGTGAAVETQLPQGVSLSSKPLVQDIGTAFVYIDPVTRSIIKTVPKDIAGKAAAEVVGEGQGKAALALPSVAANSQMLLNQLDTVANHPGKKWALGAYSTLPTIPGTNQADFRAALDQLKGGTFLQAYNTLKGGGAITEIEGEKATNALLRAQTAQSVESFDQAIRDYKAIVQGGLERARAAARGGVTSGQGSGADDAIARAYAAIAEGKDPKAVRQRLIDAGVDPGDIGK
jgi:hypothetical protein